MNAESNTFRVRPTLMQRIGWGLIGGFVAVVVFVILIGVYDTIAGPKGGGGLSGAFFAMGVFWTFVYGVIPVFVFGAGAGAGGRGKSPKVASLGLLGLI